MAMTDAQVDAWVTALRSGEYRQGQQQLFDPDDNSYCCLGVFCRIEGFDLSSPDPNTLGACIWGSGTGLTSDPRYTPEPLDAIRKDLRLRLAEKNDNGYSFAEVADEIESIRGQLTK